LQLAVQLDDVTSRRRFVEGVERQLGAPFLDGHRRRPTPLARLIGVEERAADDGSS